MKIALRKSGLRPLLFPVVALTWWRKRYQVSGTITSQKTSIEAGESTTLRHLVFACGSRLREEADSLKNLEASSCEEAVGIGDILWMNSDNQVQIMPMHTLMCSHRSLLAGSVAWPALARPDREIVTRRRRKAGNESGSRKKTRAQLLAPFPSVPC